MILVRKVRDEFLPDHEGWLAFDSSFPKLLGGFCILEYSAKLLFLSHLLGTVTTQWLDSDGVVTLVNCRQHSDYTVDQLCSHRAAGSCQQWLHRQCPVTVPSRWLME